MKQLEDFQKIGGDQNSTVLQHKDGHQVILNHATLEPGVHQAIAQHFDNGGLVNAQDLMNQSNNDVNLSSQDLGGNAVVNPGYNAPTPLQQQIEASAAQQAQDNSTPFNPMQNRATLASFTPGPNDPTAGKSSMANPGYTPVNGPVQNIGLGMNDSPQAMNPMMKATYDEMAQYGKGIGEQKAGLTGEAAATGAQGQVEALAQGDYQNQMQSAQDLYTQHTQDLGAERDALTQDIKNGHVDPERFWNSKSNLGKAEGTLGLILGGIGAGITKGPNLAAQMLQSSVDRDIDSQKMDVDNNKTLLAANRAKYGDEQVALNMTRAQLNDQLSSKLSQAASQAKDPMAQSRLMQAKGQLDQNSAQGTAQGAMRLAMMGMQGSGQMSPEMTIKMMVPPADQDKALTELDRVKNLGLAKQSALAAFEQTNKENTIGDEAKHLFMGERPSTKLFQNAVNPVLKDNEGRINEYSAKPAYGLAVAPGDKQDTINEKRKGVAQLFDEKANSSLLRSYGIDPQSVINQAAQQRAMNAQRARAAMQPQAQPVAQQPMMGKPNG